MELLKPEPGFCIRSTIASKKDKKFEQKMYVNCCMHEQVGKPSFDKQSGQRKAWLVSDPEVKQGD